MYNIEIEFLRRMETFISNINGILMSKVCERRVFVQV